MTQTATQAGQNRRPRPEAEAAPSDGDGAIVQSGSLLSDLRGAGGEGSSEFAAPTSRSGKRKFPTQHLVTLLVLVAGGGALLAMRQYGMGVGMRFNVTERIEYVQPVGLKRTLEQERVLVDLQRGVVAAAPAAADIEKNPFKLEIASAPGAILPSGPSAEDEVAHRTAEARQRRKQQIETALSGVVLNSVMGGETPLARVNGEIVRVGSVVAEVFNVVAIEGRSILLGADGQVFTVEMSQESSPRPPAPARGRKPGK